MGQDGDAHAHIVPIWRPNFTINSIGIDKNIKFSPTLMEYFMVAELDNSRHMNRECLYIKILAFPFVLVVPEIDEFFTTI
jgi:hypothetical protein